MDFSPELPTLWPQRSAKRRGGGKHTEAPELKGKTFLLLFKALLPPLELRALRGGYAKRGGGGSFPAERSLPRQPCLSHFFASGI